MLAGMHHIDEHFRTAPWNENLPALLGLIGIWNRNFWGWPTYAVLPYAQELALFPAYIQQLDMESSGKSARSDGTPAAVATGPVVWGQPGTNGQHAFHQLLHQGTDIVPADFIGFCRPNHDHLDHHDLLMANLFAQAEALAFGAPDTEDPHRQFPGNRPSTVILSDQLTPHSLGQLVSHLRAQGLHPSHHLGHKPLRPMGSRARQDPGRHHRPPTHRHHNPQPHPRLLHPLPNQSLHSESVGPVQQSTATSRLGGLWQDRGDNHAGARGSSG